MYIVIAFLVFYAFQPLKIKESGGTHERIVNREIHSDVLEIPPGLLLLAGIPDIIACIGGKFYGFEVKTERGKPTALQEATIRKINAVGGIAAVVRSVADVKAVLEEGR